MLISCPACAKDYRVPASAIPPGGREVRCSVCEMVWLERGQIAEVIGAAASGADVAPRYYGLSDQEPRSVIEAEFEAPARPKPAAPTGTSASSRSQSPARAQQRALAVVYEERAPVFVPPVSKASKPEAVIPPGEAVRLLMSGLKDKVTPIGRRVADAFRRDDGEPSAAEAAARQTRQRLRARQANKMTPRRLLGWLALVGTVAALAYALLQEGEQVREALPVTAKLYARFEPPPPTEGLQVEAKLTGYALSDQGPAVTVAGTLRNTGRAEEMPVLLLTAIGPAGRETQALPLPRIGLPSSGERPFAVRALVPHGTTGLTIEVVRAEPERRDGFALQDRGGAWTHGEASNGRAGPPELRVR